MSAFIVSQAHIDTLVNAALVAGPDKIRYRIGDNWREITDADKNRVGQALVDECVRSVSYRYPSDDVEKAELPGPTDAYYLKAYKHRYLEAQLTAPLVLKAIHCYEYQSCEHPEWEQSVAYAICRGIEAHWIRRIDGYESAPWGIEDGDVKPNGNIINLTDLIGGGR